MKRQLLLSFFILSVFGAPAQQSAQKFSIETQYLLYLPENYNQTSETLWPLVVFLHGSGERGDDVNKVKVNGPPKLVGEGRQYPFILASPQAREGEGFEPGTIKKLIDDLKKRYKVDPDRVYLTGLSMGGYSTWETAQEYPEEFAAIAPVCGGGDASKNFRLRHLPVWCFHGAKDDIVLPSESQTMVDSLKRYSRDVKFTLYPDANHNSWDVTYSNDSLYSWLLSHKRFRFKRASLPSQSLKAYAGTYAAPNGEKFVIANENDKLLIYDTRSPDDKIELIPASDTNFYIFENAMTEVEFLRTKKGIAPEFLLYHKGKQKYTRLKEKKKG